MSKPVSSDIHSFRNTRPEIVPLLPEKYSKVLEIGCGEGFFRGNLVQTCEYWGVELNLDAAKRASSRLFRVLAGSFDAISQDLPENYFDLVICNDVIEHMQDHDEFLELVKGKLSSGGFLIGSVPNVRYLGNVYEMMVKREWEYKREGILDRTHLRFFTIKSLERTFKAHDYDIVQLHGLNSVIKRSFKWKKIVDNLVMTLIILFTAGIHGDIQYMQIGFRVRYPGA